VQDSLFYELGMASEMPIQFVSNVIKHQATIKWFF
jgi:hypothetical protein